MRTIRFTGAALALLALSSTAFADAYRYGQRVYVNGQAGQVISQGQHQTSRVVVETRNASGRSTGTTTLSGYDLAFRRQLNTSTPSFQVGPRTMSELNAMRSRGY